MVVFNSSFNFVIYYRFSAMFRRNFNCIFLDRCRAQQNGLIETLKTMPEVCSRPARVRVCEPRIELARLQTALLGTTATVINIDGDGDGSGSGSGSGSGARSGNYKKDDDDDAKTNTCSTSIRVESQRRGRGRRHRRRRGVGGAKILVLNQCAC